jgi:4-hydroxy-3-methylbut-2-enyl diphosphate reductase
MIKDTGCELVFIIGSQNSSNSKRLVETARNLGIESYLIDSYRDIKEEWLNDRQVIGLSSGASAPEILIEEVIQYLRERFTLEMEEYVFKEENIKLPIPSLEGLRDK